MNSPFLIGQGYDVHRFGSKRPLILGGIEIPHDRGLVAHSDGDCLAHAITDAILGALGLPDIGNFFPDDDPEMKDIDSREIIREVIKKSEAKGYNVVNLDTTIVAETPKISPYLYEMKEALSQVVGIPSARIGIKATTNERMGCIGRGEGIAALAICLLASRT
jgi:2-C-methyl-D-erythritol 2,4-cyclodiphosphate synthase